MQQEILDRVEFDPNGGCWLWRGSCSPSYGRFRGKPAHRQSYEAFDIAAKRYGFDQKGPLL